MQSEQPKYGYGMTVSACLWLGLFPLLQGGTYARLTHDKWIIMLILTGITLACFVIDTVILRRLPRLSFRPKRSEAEKSPCSSIAGANVIPLVLCASLLLWTVLSCLFSAFGSETWWLGESARYEGLATQLCYFLLFVCFFFSRINLKPVLLSAAAGVSVFFVIVLLQRAGGNPLGLYPGGRSYAQNPEFQGTIGNIDMGTGYLLLLAGLFLYGLLPVARKIRSSGSDCHSERSAAKSKNLPAAAILSFSGIGLLLSVFLIITMDVQFGMISLGVLFLFTLLRLLPRKARLPVLVLLLAVVLLAVWFWPGNSGGIWELHEVLHGRTRLSFGSNRLAVWYYSLLLAKTSPVLGGGSGTFQARFNRFLAENDLSIPKEQDGLPLPDYFDTPHDEYIAQLTDHGLPAMLLFAALLLAAIFRRREGWLPCLAPCSAAVLCYTVQAVFSFSVCIVAPMFWVLLAISFRERGEP